MLHRGREKGWAIPPSSSCIPQAFSLILPHSSCPIRFPQRMLPQPHALEQGPGQSAGARVGTTRPLWRPQVALCTAGGSRADPARGRRAGPRGARGISMGVDAEGMVAPCSVPSIRPCGRPCTLWHEEYFSKLRARDGLRDDFINTGRRAAAWTRDPEPSHLWAPGVGGAVWLRAFIARCEWARAWGPRGSLWLPRLELR